MDQKEPPNQKTPPEKGADVAIDPSRMIGIIKRKALIKDLAAAYHAECLARCRELLELQKKWEEIHAEPKVEEEMKDSAKPARPLKRPKKLR